MMVTSMSVAVVISAVITTTNKTDITTTTTIVIHLIKSQRSLKCRDSTLTDRVCQRCKALMYGMPAILKKSVRAGHITSHIT